MVADKRRSSDYRAAFRPMSDHDRSLSETLSIPPHLNGPLDSGNGGYAAGLVAAFIEGPAEVSLRSPVPLGAPLDVVTDDGAVRLLAADSTLIAEGRPAAEPDVDVPAPVSIQQARDAAAGYRGLADGPFCRCFVCGRAREDSFGVFAGSVAGRDLVASPWTPSPETADPHGNVAPEFIWAALDCPSYFALYSGYEVLPLSALARMTAQIDGVVRAGEEHVVISWPIGIDGRKHHAGVALLSAGGETLARARALLIEPRPPV